MMPLGSQALVRWWQGAVVLPGFLAGVGVAAVDHPGQWRIYRTNDGLAALQTVAVTVSPRGSVWLKHGVNGPVSWMDGYQIHALPYPNAGNNPVYESRSGQIWSVYPEGVMEYRRDQWIQYPIQEVRLENQSSAVRLVRPVPLLPAGRDTVLIVLPDRLLKYDSLQNRITVLRHAGESRLRRFADVVEARDGSAWLSGLDGIARLPGPIRRLSPESEWEEYPLDPHWESTNLDRPFEDENGGITLTADSGPANRRVILYFNGTRWEEPIPGPDRIRNAWRGADDSLWCYSRTSLFRMDAHDWIAIQIPGIDSNRIQYFDVATQPGGLFWLATSEGVIRHAPLPWRPPLAAGAPKGPVYDGLSTGADQVWFLSDNGLSSLHEDTWRTHPSPGQSFHQPRMFPMPDGRIAINSAGSVIVFDPSTETWSELAHPSGRSILRALGSLLDGSLCVQTRREDNDTGPVLEALDRSGIRPFLIGDPDWKPGEDLHFVAESETGGFWIGGAEGAWYFERDAVSPDPTRTYSAGAALTALEVAPGRWWLGTDNGLRELEGRIWMRPPGISGRVHSLQKARDGGIWMATSEGIHRYLGGSWISNQAEEGVPGTPVYKVLADRQGNVWAVTAHGLSLHHPPADVDPPRTFLNASLNPSEVSASSVVQLAFGGRDKWDQTEPDRVVYAHRLDDRPWSAYSPETVARFTNLLAGQHHFQVRAMDRNWNEEQDSREMEFVVIVPWYQEPRLLALALTAGVVSLGLAALAVNRHRRLVRSYAEVERMVEQRTRELERANQELLHSQKMRALGTLAAGVAHDFNNILSIVKGSAQIIESNLRDAAKIQTRVDRIKTVVDQGAGIVKSMLGFSRITDRKETSCDVNRLVAETIRLLGDQFLRGITLRVETPPKLPEVRGVAEMIQQMLINFVINAAEAIEARGEITLRTGLVSRLPGGLALSPSDAPAYVFIAVEDTGAGIGPEVLPRIFEPFFTTKALSTQRGTGLGLSMVYEIAKELGYGIQVESAPGKGSTFRILMPVSGDSHP